MLSLLANKNIILGVTGSIAAYKAADLASKLTQFGALVNVILTESACKFVTPLTFQSVTGRKAYTDQDLWGGEGHVTHIGLGHSADLIVIAPASANTIARIAGGLGDNLLAVTCLAATCPILLAPAMDAGMFAHAATKANIDTLQNRGVEFIGPGSGHLASGLVGMGRLIETNDILDRIRIILGRNGLLKGRKIVVTAGGTQEPIDPVRFITNRSSGRQGYAIAQAAMVNGAEVVLIYGNVQIPPPQGCKLIKIQTAEEMLSAVISETSNADALVMAAAVADFRPVTIADRKIKKEMGAPDIRLERTSDILSEISKQKILSGYPKFTIGFAAETDNLLDNAASKLKSKNMDMIVANDITMNDAGFEVDTNRVTFLFADGRKQEMPLMDKSEVAGEVIEKLTEFF